MRLHPEKIGDPLNVGSAACASGAAAHNPSPQHNNTERSPRRRRRARTSGLPPIAEHNDYRPQERQYQRGWINERYPVTGATAEPALARSTGTASRHLPRTVARAGAAGFLTIVRPER